MISKEEMYDFASQIAGITDADLEAYKCGGKTKKKQSGGKVNNKQGNSKKVQQVGKTKVTYNSKKAETTETKTWSDGSTSSRTYDDDNAYTIYKGRKNERAMDYAGDMKPSAKADSLRRADWSGRTAPLLNKTTPKRKR